MNFELHDIIQQYKEVFPLLPEYEEHINQMLEEDRETLRTYQRIYLEKQYELNNSYD